LSLTTRQSPGRSSPARSMILRSSSSGVPPGLTTRSRAASRGTAGRSAMRSAGRSKSKSSVRMASGRYLDSRPGPSGPSRNDESLRPHGRFDDLVGVLDRFAAFDLVDVLHAGDDLAPHGVLAVEEAGVVKADKKLAIARIRVGGARHRHRAADV